MRQHFNGTNRGDVIYGVKMPSFDDPMCWKLKYSEKKLLYGKHRIAVGGAAPEGSNEGSISGILTCAVHLASNDQTSSIWLSLKNKPKCFLFLLPFPGKRHDSAEEPAFYHAGPWSLDEELLHCYSAGGINDLSAGVDSLRFFLWSTTVSVSEFDLRHLDYFVIIRIRIIE